MRLNSEARRTGKSFKEVVDDALRTWLDREIRHSEFVVEPLDLGLRPGVGVDDIGGLIERIEGRWESVTFIGPGIAHPTPRHWWSLLAGEP